MHSKILLSNTSYILSHSGYFPSEPSGQSRTSLSPATWATLSTWLLESVAGCWGNMRGFSFFRMFPRSLRSGFFFTSTLLSFQNPLRMNVIFRGVCIHSSCLSMFPFSQRFSFLAFSENSNFLFLQDFHGLAVLRFQQTAPIFWHPKMVNRRRLKIVYTWIYFIVCKLLIVYL